jgi:quinohemoprotein ethanol dehydrogenase
MRRRLVLAGLCLLAIAAVMALARSGTATAGGSGSAFLAAISPSPAFTPDELNAYPANDWLSTGGGLTDNRYSTLNQVNTSNVSQLQQAWHITLGIPAKTQAKISAEAGGIEYNGTLYITDGMSDLYALDATTGAKIWEYKPVFSGAISFGLFVNRGVAMGNGLIYEGLLDGSVVAINQQTGAEVWRSQLASPTEGYSFTSSPVYYNGQVILGVSGGDAGARGFAVSLNAATGLENWRWYVAPSPGEIGSGTWFGNEWEHGGAIWIYPSIDTVTGLVYIVTGNPVPWNGRGPGDDKWTDSIVALHVENGQFAWGFQTVHHDIWDYDVTNPPILFDATIGGQLRHGIAVASKTGWIYILDRETGKPLLGIPEKKVAQLKGSAAKYANLSPTQPFPVGEAFANHCTTKKLWPNMAPDGKPYKMGCIFTPYAPSSEGSFAAEAPSATGGVDWPPSSYNPTTQDQYVCATDGAGNALGAIPKKEQKLVQGSLYVGVNFGAGSPVLANFGRVVAMNMTTNKIDWSVKWPQPCYSGTMTTAGGLVFAGQSQIAAKKKGHGQPAQPPSKGVLTAFDASNGHVLWNSPVLAAGANAPSMTYSVNGKQYVAILAGGNNLAGSKPGDSVYAFALP